MTPSALKVLQEMAKNPNLDLTQDGIQVWLGTRRRVSYRTYKFIRDCAAVDCDDSGGSNYCVINSTGKAIVRRPELADEIINRFYTAKPFTIKGDKIMDF